MKTTILLIAILVSFNLTAQKPTDVKGWRGSEWNMSADTVKKIFANEITELQITKSYQDSYSPFFIKDYDIAGHKYRVDFLFTEYSHLLKQINLKITCTAYCGELINSIVPLLISKYGEPTFKSEKPFTYKWNFESTNIEFCSIALSDDFILVYRSVPKNNDKSKI